MRVDVNTEATVIPKDQTAPTCEVVSAEPKNASKDQDINIIIKCTDDNGTVTSSLKKGNVHVKINGEDVTPNKLEVSEGIVTTDITASAVQHTITLGGFEKSGPMTITINKGVIKDSVGNENE